MALELAAGRRAMVLDALASLPGHQDLTEAEQADSRATFRLILERCDPNLRAPESGQTMLHEVIARDHWRGASLATMLLDAGARTDMRDEFLKSTPLGWACRWCRDPRQGPSRGPHRSRGPNGINIRGLHRSSGNTELTDHGSHDRWAYVAKTGDCGGS
jgi:hypothetical protein